MNQKINLETIYQKSVDYDDFYDFQNNFFCFLVKIVFFHMCQNLYQLIQAQKSIKEYFIFLEQSTFYLLYRKEDELLIKTNQDGLNKISTDEKSRSQNLENTYIKIAQGIEKRVEKLEQSDVMVIENKLKSLKEPQNKNKYLYYQSFCPRILDSIQTCIQLETGFFQANTNVVMENKAEKLINKINQGTKLVGPVIGSVPIVGPAIEKIFELFDFGVQCHKERKLNEKLSKIMSVIKSRYEAQSERDQEFKLATFDILDLITEDDLNIKNLEYYDQVQKIIDLEQTSNKDAQNEYWQLGLYHCIIVLKYIEKESESIIAKNQDFRDIILQGLQMKALKNIVKIQKVQKPSKCCCSCVIQ